MSDRSRPFGDSDDSGGISPQERKMVWQFFKSAIEACYVGDAREYVSAKKQTNWDDFLAGASSRAKVRKTKTDLGPHHRGQNVTLANVFVGFAGHWNEPSYFDPEECSWTDGGKVVDIAMRHTTTRITSEYFKEPDTKLMSRRQREIVRSASIVNSNRDAVLIRNKKTNGEIPVETYGEVRSQLPHFVFTGKSPMDEEILKEFYYWYPAWFLLQAAMAGRAAVWEYEI